MRLKEEWPTLGMLILTYTAFAGLTLGHTALPITVVIACLAFVIAQHASLQHEVLHGHPFKSQALSDLTVFPALGLFLPYLRFKDTHLAHHYDPNLTDPYDDPETQYLDVLDWDQMPKPVQALANFNNTLLGRMVIGPAVSLAVFYRDDVRHLANGRRRIWRSYIEHAVSVALVLFWVLWIAKVPFWAYFIAAYGAMSLLKIRSYLEHRAHDRSSARSVIIEDRGPLALLFLCNNYHAVHHAHPKVHWYKLPRLYKARREQFLTRNGGYRYRSYAQVIFMHLFNSKDPVAHPLWSRDNRTKP